MNLEIDPKKQEEVDRICAKYAAGQSNGTNAKESTITENKNAINNSGPSSGKVSYNDPLLKKNGGNVGDLKRARADDVGDLFAVLGSIAEEPEKKNGKRLH